jgi:hypothetical protein
VSCQIPILFSIQSVGCYAADGDVLIFLSGNTFKFQAGAIEAKNVGMITSVVCQEFTRLILRLFSFTSQRKKWYSQLSDG